MTALAAAATAHFNRVRADEWLEMPNVTNLVGRFALCVAVAGAQLYLLDTRHPGAPASRRRAIYAGSVVAGGVSFAAWLAAPIHTAELPDLADAPRHAASLVYAVTIYLYLAWFEVELARYAHRSYRPARATDPPAAAAIALIGAAAWVGVLVLLTWATHSATSQLTGQPTPYLDRVATVLFPISLVLHAAGLLALPLLPAIAHRTAARRLTAQLEPLWRLALHQHPHVHLPLRQDRLTRAIDPRLRAQRRLIEISDALEEHRVVPARSLSELAQAISSPAAQPGEGLSAKDALTALSNDPWPEPLISLSNTLRATARHARRG